MMDATCTLDPQPMIISLRAYAESAPRFIPPGDGDPEDPDNAAAVAVVSDLRHRDHGRRRPGAPVRQLSGAV